MHGRFEVGAYHTPGLTQARLDAELGPRAQRKAGCVEDFLSQFDKQQEVKGDNLIFDNMAGYMFKTLFGGPSIPIPYNYGSGGSALGVIALTFTDTEPSYQETNGSSYIRVDEVDGDRVSSSAPKRFYDDEIEPYLISEGANGKESITYRGRWLWLPSQAVSSVIRSISAHFRENNSTSDTYTGRVARIRLKDSGGNPITINKTSSVTLFVEYRVTLVSV